LETAYLDPAGFDSFEIRESGGGEKTALILPDIATCPECLREICDRSNRRYRYPFTNCTNCGPRYTIIESLPYDRPRTIMKEFVMCDECLREYGDPADRRFHAQPNACPKCGPTLELWNAEGRTLAREQDALLATAEALRAGQIAAVKGLGGGSTSWRMRAMSRRSPNCGYANGAMKNPSQSCSRPMKWRCNIATRRKRSGACCALPNRPSCCSDE
jgi:hydrogenase maturation protein HypF